MSSIDVFPEGFLELLFGYYHRFVKAFLESPLGRPASHYEAMLGAETRDGRMATKVAKDSRHLLVAAELLHHRDDLRERGISSKTVTRLASKLARQATARVPRGRSGLDLVGALREYPHELLLELLSHVGHPACAGAVAAALGEGWERSRPLVEMLVRTAELYAENGREHKGSDPRANSPDQDLGVLDAPALRRAWEEAGPFREEVLRLYREAGYEMEGTLWLMEAALGEHRQWIMEKFEKRKHPAVKALGLLPIEGGPEEVRERYHKIRRFERESKQFGSQRRATEGAAAAVALKNLATNAGYPDVRRLSWAMAAAELLEDGSATKPEAAEGSLRRWSVGDYEAEVVFEEEKASVQLLYHRGEKTLKSVPRAVKQSELYPELKETLAGARREVSSLRKTLEEMMAAGETLSRDDLRALWALPAGRVFLERLILSDEEGNFGLPRLESAVGDPVAPMLVPPEDSGEAKLLRGCARIVHPYHLYAAGPEVLSAWQQEVVRQSLVQPIRQAFRELYVLTQAERDLRTHSPRFSDHVVDSRAAARLLGSRGWYLGGGEDALPEKTFRTAGLVAIFEFDDVGHYFTELDTVTTGHIRFHSLGEVGGYGDIVPVDEVPPTVFSEVLRDADLVVSVAQAEGEGERLSEEGLIRRAELLSTLVEKLGVPGVSVSGRFARVRGKLADYRVHLGSGAVHVEPAGHLCIVPASRLRERRPLLPFAEETEADRKAREVVSKVLLLARDEKIKDESILAQIRRR
jgi:hypothetical protein